MPIAVPTAGAVLGGIVHGSGVSRPGAAVCTVVLLGVILSVFLQEAQRARAEGRSRQARPVIEASIVPFAMIVLLWWAAWG